MHHALSEPHPIGHPLFFSFEHAEELVRRALKLHFVGRDTDIKLPARPAPHISWFVHCPNQLAPTRHYLFHPTDVLADE